jgi:hypothetical protein
MKKMKDKYKTKKFIIYLDFKNWMKENYEEIDYKEIVIKYKVVI